MIGNYFYNETIRKTVIAFGTLFNNITIKKYASDGKSISQIKVPIAYGPIQRFLARIEQQSNFDDNVAISLPRLSFELSSYTYDATRKASPIQKFTMKSPSQKTKIKKMFLPVPYDVGFRLSFATKLQDDALQIIEQILPFFQPAYSVTVNMLEGVEEKRDIPFTLTNVSFTDEYEGDFSTRRFIQYDLDFVAKTYFYQEVPTDENGIIKKVQIDYSTAIRAPREQRYTVVPQAAKDYNDDGTGSLAATLTTKQTLVKVTSGSSFTVGGFIQINSEVMKIKEISGNDLIVNRGQFGTSIDSHASGDSIDLVNKSDSDLIDYGDTFGFTETRSFFDADGLEFSTVTGTDEL
jgi:hypothetical protein|tara:strand:- start:473 stop:1522 length:1050 start_codon:yes stop_codon:yes gene_type:complete